MADRGALGAIGMMLGVVTLLVVSASAVTVSRGVVAPYATPATSISAITVAAR